MNSRWLVNEKCTFIDLPLLNDQRGYSLLLLAVEAGNIEAVKRLLKLRVSHHAPEKNVSVQSIAYDLGHHDIFLMLAQRGFLYPPNVDINNLTDEFRAFYAEVEDVHAAVIANNKEQIMKAIKKCKYKHVYYMNLSNESAARKALTLVSQELHDFLLSKDIYFAPHEYATPIPRADKTDEKDDKEESMSKHVGILLARISGSHDEGELGKNMKYIKMAIYALARDKRTDILLKIIAALKSYDLIFDFSRDVVNVLDPTTDAYSEGLFYPMGRIYVGARLLLNVATKTAGIATVGHELCHFACFIMFKNFARPYERLDLKTEQEFEEINKLAIEHMEVEEIVSLVYKEYPQEVHHAELIVRVPHIAMQYYENQPKFLELRETFKQLFLYYEDRLIPIFEKKIPTVEESEGDHMGNFVERVSSLWSIWALSLSVLAVFSVILFFGVRRFFLTPYVNFSELSEEKKLEVENAWVRYRKIDVQMKDLFVYNSSTYYNITSEHLNELLDGTKLDFDDPHIHYLDTQVYFSWFNLTDKLKPKLKAANISFQEWIIDFKQMQKISNVTYEQLNSEQIVVALNNSDIPIGRLVKNETKFILERTFYFRNGTYDYLTNVGKHDFNNFYDANATERERILKQENLIEDGAKIFTEKSSNHSIFVNVIHNFDEVQLQVKKDRMAILSAVAGAGKTTTFKRLTRIMKKREEYLWVQYIDMKHFIHHYRADGNISEPMQSLKHAINPGSDYEWQVFTDVFNRNEAILLWNGFDEISPIYSDYIVNLIKFVYNNTKNLQMICTRPLYVDILERAFNCIVYYIKPIEKNEQMQFLQLYFTHEKITDKKNIANYTERTQRIAEKFNYDTPLMLKLLADIHEDITLSDETNYYSIYEIFVSKKIWIWQRKISYYAQALARKILTGLKFEIKNVYHKYALMVQCSSVQSVKRLKVSQTVIPDEIKIDEISRMGILYLHNLTDFEFAHDTFGTFFAAQYLVTHVINNTNTFNEDDFEVLYSLQNHEKIVPFVHSHLDRKFLNGSDNINNRLVKILKTKHEKFLFHMLVDFGIQTLDLFVKLFSRDKNLLIDLLHVNQDVTLYTESFMPFYEFRTVTRRKTPQEVLNITGDFLHESDWRKFLNGRNQLGKVRYGMDWHKYNKKELIHHMEVVKATVTEEDLEGFYENNKNNLTDLERQELLKLLLTCPGLKTKNDIFRRDYYEKLWKEAEQEMSKREKIDILGKILSFNYHEFGLEAGNFLKFWSFILKRVNQLESKEIFDLFHSRQVLQNILLTSANNHFNQTWQILYSRTTKEQRKELLMKEYSVTPNQFILTIVNNALHADRYKFKLFHIFCVTSFTQVSVDFGFKIYEEHFSQKELQELILASIDFLPYVIFAEGKAESFVRNLERIFKDREADLYKFLTRKFEGIELTIFTYFDGLIGVNVNDKLKYFVELKEKLKENPKVIEEIQNEKPDDMD